MIGPIRLSDEAKAGKCRERVGSPDGSHLSPDGGSLSRAAVHRLAADGYDSAAIANQDRASDARDEKKTWKIQIPCARKQKEALLPSSGCCSGEVKSTFGFYRTLSGHFGSVFPPNRWAEPRNQKTPSCFQVQPILVQA